LHPRLFPDTFAHEMARRIVLWLPTVGPAGALLAGIRTAMTAARALPPGVGTALARSWCNGWTTSFRRHILVTRCVFGCGHGSDTLAHYTQCSALAAHLDDKVPICATLRSTGRPAMLRFWALDATCPRTAAAAAWRLYVATDAYHRQPLSAAAGRAAVCDA
jgi:hypothetical protein